MSWNPEQYLKYAQPRLRPALDLLCRIDTTNPKHIYDLGCGTGSITRLLAERWPAAEVTGVDDSAEMLAKAASESGRIRWSQESLAHWRAETPADLIYSNAALHWLPDHAHVFPKLIESVAPGGVLAVQMPRNFSAPSHQLMYETARSGPWAHKLVPLITPAPVQEPAFYVDLLTRFTNELDIWETEYLHVLEGKDPVKEWTKGTWLKRFLDALEEPERTQFEADYARRVGLAYPPREDGRTLFPFRRLFIVARRGS